MALAVSPFCEILGESQQHQRANSKGVRLWCIRKSLCTKTSAIQKGFWVEGLRCTPKSLDVLNGVVVQNHFCIYAGCIRIFLCTKTSAIQKGFWVEGLRWGSMVEKYTRDWKIIEDFWRALQANFFVSLVKTLIDGGYELLSPKHNDVLDYFTI